eukprot:2215505-Pleurochrysis_carterae.AAC.2
MVCGVVVVEEERGVERGQPGRAERMQKGVRPAGDVAHCDASGVARVARPVATRPARRPVQVEPHHEELGFLVEDHLWPLDNPAISGGAIKAAHDAAREREPVVPPMDKVDGRIAADAVRAKIGELGCLAVPVGARADGGVEEEAGAVRLDPRAVSVEPRTRMINRHLHARPGTRPPPACCQKRRPSAA